MIHTEFNTTTRGLNRNTPPMLLYERAKKYGIWNPGDLDFSEDKAVWATLKADEKDIVLRLTAMFVAGEEAVTQDILPLINVIAQEGRLEEEMYLTTFLWEEAKHVDFFSRVLSEVFEAPLDLTEYQSPHYREVVYEVLPQALNALRESPTPATMVRASSVYNMIVEGMLAETGYHAYYTIIDRFNILHGIREGIRNLQMDESRHIAYGVYLLSRLMAEDPDLWTVIETTMNELFAPALGVITDIFAHYDPVPFGITCAEFSSYAAGQFQKRLDRIRKARGLSQMEVDEEAEMVIRMEDA